MSEDLLNVMGSFSETALDCIEKQNEEIEQLQQENSQLKERIEKAIEIINQMIFKGYAKGGTIYMATSEKSEFGSRAKIILEVLKGDKE